jgi:hypothetical protein
MDGDKGRKRSETWDDYVADDRWADEGGNITAGDPAPPAQEVTHSAETSRAA